MATETCSLCNGPSSVLYEKMSDRLFGSSGEWSILRCNSSECGLMWVYPKPTSDELSKSYENYYTHVAVTQESFIKRQYDKFKRGYLSARFGYPATKRKTLDKIGGRLLAFFPHRKEAFNASVMWLKAQPGGRLLEIGCGNGERMTLLVSLGWNVEGLESDATSAGIACNSGLQVTVSTLEKAQLPSDSFDAIIMSHVIEHLPNPRWVIKECLRLLKPGGRLVMLTPNTDSLGHRWYGMDWLHLDPPRHLFLFNRASMYKIFDGIGYSHISCQSVIRDANWTLAASWALKKTDHYTFGSLLVRERMYGLGMLYYEWIRMKFSPFIGEDLLLMARK